jgi:hypothetical protein
MELTLNFAWALLATLMFWLWMRHALGEGTRRPQLVALAVVILILLPVISVTDDLQTLQNPAELDCCARRHYAASSSHSIFPAAAMLPPPVFAELSFGLLRLSAPGNRPAPLVEIPALSSIQNRPPPAA